MHMYVIINLTVTKDDRRYEAWTVAGPFKDGIGVWLAGMIDLAGQDFYVQPEEFSDRDLSVFIHQLGAVHAKNLDHAEIVKDLHYRAESAAASGRSTRSSHEDDFIGC